MHPANLATALRYALNEYYTPHMSDTIPEGRAKPSTDGRIDVATNRLAQQIAAVATIEDPHVQDILHGRADPEVIRARYEAILQGNTALTTTRPQLSITQMMLTPVGEVIAGPAHEFLSPRGALTARAQQAHAAFLFTPQYGRGFPVPASLRLYVDGNEMPEVGEHALAGGALIAKVTPFEYLVTDDRHRPILQGNLLNRYADDVAALTKGDDYRRTFELFTEQLLTRAQVVRQSAAELYVQSQQDLLFYEEEEQEAVLHASLSTMGVILAGVQQQASIMVEAYIKRSPLARTLYGRFAGTQIAGINNKMVLPNLITDEVNFSEREDLLFRHDSIGQLLGGDSFAGFVDMINYLQYTFAYDSLTRSRNVQIEYQGTHPTFRSSEPIPVRFLIDEILFRAFEVNAPQTLRFFFDEPKQQIKVSMEHPMNRQLRDMLFEVGERWNFQGRLRFDTGSAGINAVVIDSGNPGFPASRLGPGGNMLPQLARPASSLGTAPLTAPVILMRGAGLTIVQLPLPPFRRF